MFMRMAVHSMLIAGVFVLQTAIVGVLAADAFARRDTYLVLVLAALVPFLVYSLVTVPRATFLPPTAARGAFHAFALAYALALVGGLFGAARIVCVDARDTTPGLLRRTTLLTYAERAVSVAGMYLITGTARLVYACCCHARMLADDIELAGLVARLDTFPASMGRAGAARRRRRDGDGDGDIELEDASARVDSLYATRGVT